ncbi:MAG: hypothetical protein K9L22_12570 [Methylococcaceae bacterium]|nr:hypothetical protein [Methylococcaceae bacterium]
MNKRTSKVLDFINKTIEQKLDKIADKKGHFRKSSWDVKLYIPEEMGKLLLCKYDHTFQFVLMGDVKDEVLIEIFDELKACLVTEDQVNTVLISKKSDINFEITCPCYKEGSGGRIYFVEEVKESLLRKRKIRAVFE